MKSRHLLYRHAGSNMAGDHWEWCLYISKEPDGSWTLWGELLPVLNDESLTIGPVLGIKDGIELYDEFRSAMISDEAGLGFDQYRWIDIEQIRENLLEVDYELMRQFMEGKLTREERE